MHAISRRMNTVRDDRVVVLIAVTAFAVWLLLASLTPTGQMAWLLAALGLLVCAASCWLLCTRRRLQAVEINFWRPVSWAGLAIGSGFVLQTLALNLTSAKASVGAHSAEAAAHLAQLTGCILLYRGLVQWNRFRTAISDPADWLNGGSAIFAAAAIGALVVDWTGIHATGWAVVEQQLWLLTCSAAAVVLGTLGTVTSLAGLNRDPRMLLLGGAMSAALFGQFARVPGHNRSTWAALDPAQAGWLLCLLLLAGACRVRIRAVSAQPSTTMSATIGTLVVLLASVGILAVEAVTHVDAELPVAYAVLAVIGSSIRGVRIVQDLTQLARSRMEARTDELTGMANRRELMSRLDVACHQSGGAALLLIDLNRFKDINDRFGHATGDDLLRRMTRRLARTIPAEALLARLGGDEFAILLGHRDQGQLTELADQLVTAVRRRVAVNGFMLTVGVSIGVASAPPRQDVSSESAISGDELLRRADIAMYDAKRHNAGHRLYSAALDAELVLRAERAEQIRHVLTAAEASDGDQLHVLYQPQVDARTGQTIRVEALVRWQHPTAGLLLPASFIDLIEDQGLMPLLTTYVVETAVAQCADWLADGLYLPVAVNVSANCLTENLLATVQRSLAARHLPARSLTVEITETALMQDPDRAVAIVRRLSDIGVSVSIDDYGTGYSSLSYLSRLAADELKIDRSLVQQAITDHRAAAIVAGTIELAHRLGLTVVAEGIETQTAHDMLRNYDCDVLQGYLYGPAVTSTEIRDRFRLAELPQPRGASVHAEPVRT